jgi:hypothetical protein
MCGKPADTFGGQCERCASLQVLGLGMNASEEEIESAYLTLVKVWHPDRFQSDQKLRSAAEEKLKDINAAHDYLKAAPPLEEGRPFGPEPGPVPKPEESPKQGFAPTETVATEAIDEELADEVRRVLKRYETRSWSKGFFKVAAALGGVAVVSLLWVAIDFFLSANPTTARPWEEYKAEVSRELHANGLRLWSSATRNVHASKSEDALPPAVPAAKEPAPAEAAAAKVETPGKARPVTATNEAHGAKPYLTSGLTPMEVLSILGNPTSSSGEKMFYQRSEIDFKNGHVAGWKIDSKSPIRVKLWPDRPLLPGMVAFAVGSSKSDVIALQGTPTLFSDNEFGYGGSVVFFQNDHVVSWKEDPASVRLRVAH